MEYEQSPSILLQFVPLLTMAVIFVPLGIILATRKGKSRLLFVLVAFVPIVNFLALIWLASLTDQAVLEELAKLRGKVESAPDT